MLHDINYRSQTQTNGQVQNKHISRSTAPTMSWQRKNCYIYLEIPLKYVLGQVLTKSENHLKNFAAWRLHNGRNLACRSAIGPSSRASAILQKSKIYKVYRWKVSSLTWLVHGSMCYLCFFLFMLLLLLLIYTN